MSCHPAGQSELPYEDGHQELHGVEIECCKVGQHTTICTTTEVYSRVQSPLIRARSAPLISPSHIARTSHTLTELVSRNVTGSVAVDGREPVPEPKQGVHPSARCDTDRGARGLGALLTAGLHQQVVLGAARGRTRQGRRRAHHRTRAGARRTRRRGRHHSQVRRRRILRLRRSLRRTARR